MRSSGAHCEERQKKQPLCGFREAIGYAVASPASDQQARWMALREAAGENHDVSILIGVGADHEVGCMPAAKVSMMIMRPPQRGQGHGNWRWSSQLASSVTSSTTAGTLKRWRSRAMLAALLPLANKP